MDKRTLIEELPFEVDARVAIQLGRESISSSLIALIELVKNAYDADAENVMITFRNLGMKDSLIIFEDDGLGMSESDIKKHWLRIGTDFKQNQKKSKTKKRILTGAKGLGRLGIDRLCEKLVLQSKIKQNQFINELEIIWNKYEKANENLSNVKHSLYKNAIPQDSCFLNKKSRGTRLFLLNLKDQWSIGAIKDLKNELALLISPFGGINDFTINIDTEYDEDDLNGPVTSKHYLEAAEWAVESSIDKDNNVQALMYSNIHNKQFELKPVIWKDWIKSQTNIPLCGPLSFKFYYIPQRSAEEFKKINFDSKHIREFLKNNRGIKIYRDHFRAKPYGNPDGSGDWLNLGYRRSANPAASSRIGWPVAPQQIVGGIFISREKNKGLIDQTNREGIVEEQPFFDLRAYTMKIIEWFEVNVVKFNQSINKDKRKESDKIKESTSKVRNKIDTIKKNVEDMKSSQISKQQKNTLNLIIDDINNIESDLDKSDKQINELEKQIEEEKNTLANLASLGILTVCFGHEAKGHSTKAHLNAKKLKRSVEEGQFMILPDIEETVNTQLRIILESTNYINTFAAFALDKVKRDKRNKTDISISEEVNYVIKSLKQSFEKQGITVDTKNIQKDVPTIKGYKIDWESIFVNLITNSIWAFRGYTPAGKREIKISIHQENDLIKIRFADNGKGLEKGTEDQIFLPGYSTRRNEKGIVDGTGMGLAIVYTLICDHAGGEIEAKSPGELGGAEFIIKLPIDVRK